MATDLARVIRLPRTGERQRQNVVAVILEDGTVRRVDGEPTSDDRDWNEGQITGDEWVLWWQRRSFTPQ